MQYNDETFWVHEYNLTDHLGNTRIVFAAHSNGQPELMQQTSYYPFGMTMQQQNFGSLLNQPNKLLYNGKELQDDELAGVSLDWYDYGARYYDPALARFHTVDPMAEEREWLSPFNYVQNNPILRIDPDGALDDEYTVDKNTGERKKVSNLGGDEVDFIHYGEYKDNGTAFVADKTVQAERAAPKENLGFTGEKIKSQVNSDFEKYSFERYWKGKGDYHLQVNEFENIVANSKVEKELSPITLSNNLTVTPKQVSLYVTLRPQASCPSQNNPSILRSKYRPYDHTRTQRKNATTRNRLAAKRAKPESLCRRA